MKWKVVLLVVTACVVIGFSAYALGIFSAYLSIILIGFLIYCVIDIIKTGFKKFRAIKQFFSQGK